MKIMKVLSILLVVAMIVAMGATNVFAATVGGQVIPDAGSTEAGNKILAVGGNLMGTIQVVGIVVAVIILMVIGIKYMMGSAEEKAEYKKTMIPYIVGAVLIFAATTLANLAYNFANSLK